MGQKARGQDGDTAQEVYTEEEKSFEEKKESGQIFIVGGGTSVNDVLDNDILKRKLQGYALMGCNKSVELIDCDYMVYHDLKFGIEYAHLLTEFKGEGGVHAPLPTKLNLDQQNDTANYFKRSKDVSFDLKTGINTGNNCGVAALSLAIALGYNEIFLLGMDGRFSAGNSHCHGGYGHNPNENCYTPFSHFFEFVGGKIKAQRPDVDVYNCSFISLMDIQERYFKRLNIKDVLCS